MSAEPSTTREYGPDADQCMDVFLPSHPNDQTVVVVHGGFWRPIYDRMHARDEAQAIADLGYLCLLPEYRRVPGSPDVLVDDLVAAIESFGCDNPILIGHSAGGHLALIVGPRLGAKGVISLGGVNHLAGADERNLGNGAVRDFLGVAVATRIDLDPVMLPEPDYPVVLVHGTADADVPHELSADLAEAWPACEVRLLDGVDHGSLIDPTSAAWPAVVDAIRRCSS